MSYCPACNGFEQIEDTCKNCGSQMVDKGRYFDYFDDYSAYMPINTMKLFDGIANDYQKEQCPHLLVCEVCHQDKVALIQEQN